MTQAGWEIRPLGWVFLIALLLIVSLLLARWVRRWSAGPEAIQ
jgi:hypothetical protein